MGVLLRFGRFRDIVQPGLVFKLPLGIDQITLVEVQRQLKLEFGFFAPLAATNSAQAPPPEIRKRR